MTRAFPTSSGTLPSLRDVLKMSVSILLCSLRILGVKLSGPGALLGFNLDNCLDTPLAIMLISGFFFFFFFFFVW